MIDAPHNPCPIFAVTAVPVIAGIIEMILPGPGQRLAAVVSTFMAAVPAAYRGAIGICFGAYAAGRSFEKIKGGG